MKTVRRKGMHLPEKPLRVEFFDGINNDYLEGKFSDMNGCKNYFFFFVMVVSCQTYTYGQSNVHRTKNWITDSNAQPVAYSGGYTMLAGGNKVGPFTGSGVVVDPLTGNADFTMPKVNGSVYVSISDGANGVYVGGNFSFIDDFPIKNLAHIKADKTLDTGWTPNPDGDIEALTVNGGTLYVGGSFHILSGQTRNYIASFSVANGNLNTWNPSVSDLVTTISVSGNNIYIGGFFTTVGGLARNKVAAIDATTGLPTSWAPSLTGSTTEVIALVATPTTIYIGGYFTGVAASARASLAAVGTNGTLLAWNPNLGYTPYTPSITCLLLSGNTLYIGGTFTSVNGGKSVANNLAAVNATTGVATGWAPILDYNISSFALSGNTLYIGGGFTNIDGTSRTNLAGISIVDGSLLSWDPMPSSSVNTISLFGNNIFIGGYFSGINWTDKPDIALLHDDTDTVWPYTINLNGGQVYTMVIQNNIIYIGGSFSIINNKIPRKNLAAIDLSTGTVLPWAPGADGTTATFDNTAVRTMKIKGNLLYIGGTFLNINNAGVNTARPNLAALDLTTGVPSSWNPVVGDGKTTSQYVNSIDIVGNTLYVGGAFNLVGNQTRTDIAAIDIASGNVLPWAPVSNGQVRKVRVAPNAAYVIGDFANGIGGAIRLNGIAALDLTTAKATAWNPPLQHGQAADIALSLSDIYVAGYYDSVATEPRQGLSSYALSTGLLNAWNPDLVLDEGGITSIDTSPNRLHAGGSIGRLGHESRYGYAEYDLCPTGFDLTMTGSVLSAPTASTYQWYKDGTAIPGATSQTLAVSYLENGTYYVEIILNGCTGRSNDFVYLITGQAKGEPSRMKVFPNPVKEELFIEVPQPSFLTILDVMGRNVKSDNLFSEQANRIETRDLNPGTYILIVQTGNVKSYFKILKIH